MNRKWLGIILLLIAPYVSAQTAHWVTAQHDQGSITYIDRNSIQIVDQRPHVVQYQRRSIYQHAVPQWSIPAQGYTQGIERMNCDNETHAIIESGFYTPKGKPIGDVGRLEHIYFDSIADDYELHHVYRVVCS